MIHEVIDDWSWEGEPSSYRMNCGCCHTNFPGLHRDPGVAAEKARKAGWVTKRTGYATPLKWVCPRCQK